MARAETQTWLALDDWAAIMGYNRWLFNGFKQLPSTIGSECHDIWYQFAEQSDNVSREELAMAIRQAEIAIANFVGYNLLPDWNSELVTPIPFYKPGYTNIIATTGKSKSVKVKKGYLHQLGIKANNFLETVPITLVDLDGDGFNETAQATITNWGLDYNQIRLFYAGKNGGATWEIRPITFVNATTIQMPAYLIGKWQNQQSLVSPIPLDPRQATSYVDEVDVYQVYNDTTVLMDLIYDECDPSSPCTQTSATSCAYIDNYKLGWIAYDPNYWQNCNCDVHPDRMQLYYYGGWKSDSNSRPLVEIDNVWKQAIAALSVGYFNKTLRDCCGGNQSARANKWAEDIIVRTRERSYFVSEFVSSNPFGITTVGAFQAYMVARNYKL